MVDAKDAPMKYCTTLILALFASNLFSEELSSMSREEIDAIPSDVSQISIPLLAGISKIAGIGMFANIPSPTNSTVDIAVQQWWTPNPGTSDTLRVHNIYEGETNWIFPTNEPVVFFATVASNLVKHTCIGEHLMEHMTQEELERPVFWHVDRSWFRVSRDNGLLYSFTTNMWQHTYVSQNLTNKYEALRDVFSSVYTELSAGQTVPSWRVAYDSYEGLQNIIRHGSEKFLAEMMVDPQLPELIQIDALEELKERFCWDFDTNGVFRAPDTAALDFASSNFTAQALAIWRTHDTNSIITFAQNSVATNAAPESLLFRSAVAYYLENDIATATNLIVAADLLVNESSVHTPNQKKIFSQASGFLLNIDSNPTYVEFLGRFIYLEGKYLEVFGKEHFSDVGIFEKFGGEFPFSKTLKYMYNRE
jgi:hypothetical protein